MSFQGPGLLDEFFVDNLLVYLPTYHSLREDLPPLGFRVHFLPNVDTCWEKSHGRKVTTEFL